jgi:hypothetical protein
MTVYASPDSQRAGDDTKVFAPMAWAKGKAATSTIVSVLNPSKRLFFKVSRREDMTSHISRDHIIF